MLSTKLIQMIEEHANPIADRVIRQLRAEARLAYIAHLPDAELRKRCLEILNRLGHWLAASREEEVATHYERLGQTRCREKVPLHEVVHAFHVLKARMLDYVRDQGISQTVVDLYAEEELELQIGRFFDAVVYYVIRGYEKEWRVIGAASGAR